MYNVRKLACIVESFAESSYFMTPHSLILSTFSFNRLLSCGFHRCQRTCHDEDCGTCTTVCGKPRKSWLARQRHLIF